MSTAWVKSAVLGLGLGIAISGCKKEEPPPEEEPWKVAVSSVSASSGTPGAGASRCAADGSSCVPLEPGKNVELDALIQTSPGGRAELEIGQGAALEIGPSSEVLLRAGDAPSLEVRSGRVVVEHPEAEKAPILRVAGSAVALDPTMPTEVAVEVLSPGRARMTVHRGQLSVGTAKLRAGTNVQLAAGQAPDVRAGWSLAPVARAFAGEAAKGLPSEPRGFGRMTARIPRTKQVREGVRLASHHVRVVIRDGFARTEVEEVFQNDTDIVLEGRYIFPLPADASISRLALWVGKDLIEGEVVERKRAAQIFKSIVDAPLPRDPALLEWVTGGEFSLKIFPILAKGSRKVLLAYNQALPTDGGTLRYVYPMSLGADRATKIDDFSITVTASDTRADLSDVRTPGYPAALKVGKEATTATFTAKSFAPTSDFQLAFERASTDDAQVSAYVPKWGEFKQHGLKDVSVAEQESGFFALRVTAELPAGVEPPPFVARSRAIVLDTSYSQSKATIDAEIRVATGLLEAMDPDEKFVLLACDSACSPHPEAGLAPATTEAITLAKSWLAERQPGGSSDIAGAIGDAARRLPADGSGQLVYIGDGAPTAGELSAEAINERVTTELDGKKLDLRFLGAGRSVDEVTLRGLAQALGATYEAVSTGEGLPRRIADLALGLRRPVVSSAKIELPGAFIDYYPKVLPNLRLGQEVLVVGKLGALEPGEVELMGELDGKPYRLTKSIRWTEEARAQNPLVPRVWAESRIADLQFRSGDDELVKEIVDLSQRFHVMSRHTSFLVLESEKMFADFGVKRTTKRADDQSDAAFGEDDSAVAPQEDESESAPAAPSKRKVSAADLDAAAKSGSGVGPGGGGLSGIGDLGSSGRVGQSRPKPRGPRGSARVGGASVSGGVVSNAAAVVARMRGRFRACYMRALQRDPSAAGRVMLIIRVGPTGSVVGASARPSGNVGQASPCIAAAARAARFSAPEGGGATIQVPIVLVSDGVGPSSWAPPNVHRPRPRRNPGPTATHLPGSDDWMTEGAEALELLRKAVAENEKSRKAHVDLVRGLIRRGRFPEALTSAEKFAALDPDYEEARTLLAYAATVNGQRDLALAAVDSQTETNRRSVKSHMRAARAFEAARDERRACAHWRSLSFLKPSSDETRYQSLRCRARTMGEGARALAEAKNIEKPGPLVKKLIPLIESERVPAYDPTDGNAGQFEAKLECEVGQSDCPVVVIITPKGTVFSPWTPASSRSSAASVAFSGIYTGRYRTVRIGGAPGVRGEVKVRAASAIKTFPLGDARTIAHTDVKSVPWGRLGIGGWR